MIDPKEVKRPKTRGKLRKFLGKRYFILKRRWKWFRLKDNFAVVQKELFDHEVMEHSTILLRKLKDVEMQYQYNKITNLKLAIERIDSVVIDPGQTFSLWYLVGKPSKKRGFLKGLVLNNGTIGYDYGGGLCQLGNLLYWMVIHTHLTVTERWRHGYDVFPDVNRKLPFGSGATLSYNYIDFQFKNNTENSYQLHLYLSEDRLHGKVLSNAKPSHFFEVYEDYHLIKHQLWGGYTRHNRLNRRKFDVAGNLLADETMVENHAIMMYEPLLKAQGESS
ncbi:MAG: VanW family protein [Bacteroidota bacterium]